MSVFGSVFAKKRPPNETVYILCVACGYLYTSTTCTDCDGCSFREICIRKLNPGNITREGLCSCCQENVSEKMFLGDVED